MSKATPGRAYTVVHGDTLSGIAAAAYGQASKWRIIFAANTLRSGDPDLIYPGEILLIPGTAPPPLDKKDPKAPAKGGPRGSDPDQLSISINGKFLNIISASYSRAIDSCADGIAASIVWDGNRSALPAPFGFELATVFLGEDLLFQGRVYQLTRDVQADDLQSTIEIWSPAADLVDSTISPPLEFKDLDLGQIAKDVAGRFGLDVEIVGSVGAVFKRAAAERTDLAWDFLSGLAEQRGAVITSGANGGLAIYKIDPKKPTVGSLRSRTFPLLSASLKLDGRARFSEYTAISTTPKKHAGQGVAKDPAVPSSRILCFRADENDDHDLPRAAEWKRKRTAAEAETLTVKVAGWRSPVGLPWSPGQMVSVEIPELTGSSAINYLIKKVSGDYAADGSPCTLELCHPTLFMVDTA